MHLELYSRNTTNSKTVSSIENGTLTLQDAESLRVESL